MRFFIRQSLKCTLTVWLVASAWGLCCIGVGAKEASAESGFQKGGEPLTSNLVAARSADSLVRESLNLGSRGLGGPRAEVAFTKSVSGDDARSPAAVATIRKPIVLAFYHPWYGNPSGSAKQWYKWDSFRFPGRYDPERIKADGRRDIASEDYPLIGAYDQGDPEVVRWHFRLAKAAGIDGFLCSWWKFRERSSHWDQWQSALFEKVLLPIAEEEDFKVAIIDECAHYVKNYDQLLWRITNNLPRVARNPAYLKISGQPVWFIYQVWDDWLTAERAGEYVRAAEQSVGDVFWMFDKLKTVATAEPPYAKMFVLPEWLAISNIDCFGTYSYVGHWRDTNAASIRELYTGFATDVRGAGKQVQLPVLPGHDNTPVHAEPFVVPRNGGATLTNFLRAVDAAKPEIVTVCSFNEWLETTQIEPSANWENPYLYLEILARWRGKEWKTPPLPPESSRDKPVKREPADDGRQ